MHMGPWDWALLAVVSTQATALAYLYHPKWKALLYSVPFPFTLASLALGQRVGITNVAGLPLLLVYAWGVRLLHVRLRVPIVWAIVASVLLYCGVAVSLVGVLPRGEAAFWVACGVMIVVGAGFYIAIPHREEPGHRTPLPVWIKLPAVACVILGLIAAKQTLQGFMTMFPMVGVVAAYEKRYSLWTLARQAPVIVLGVVPLMAVSHALHPHVGLGASLALGWVVFLAVLYFLTRHMWRQGAAADDGRG